MKIFVFVILALFGAISTEAAVSMSMPSTHPDFPNKCYDNTKKIAYEIGSHYPEGKCIKIYCNEDYSMDYYSCGAISPPPGYHNEVDLTKQYPDCCVKFVKNEDNEIDQ